MWLLRWFTAVLSCRLRAGLCDRCTVTQELAKRRQQEFEASHVQSLQHISLLGGSTAARRSLRCFLLVLIRSHVFYSRRNEHLKKGEQAAERGDESAESGSAVSESAAGAQTDLFSPHPACLFPAKTPPASTPPSSNSTLPLTFHPLDPWPSSLRQPAEAASSQQMATVRGRLRWSTGRKVRRFEREVRGHLCTG